MKTVLLTLILILAISVKNGYAQKTLTIFENFTGEAECPPIGPPSGPGVIVVEFKLDGVNFIFPLSESFNEDVFQRVFDTRPNLIRLSNFRWEDEVCISSDGCCCSGYNAGDDDIPFFRNGVTLSSSGQCAVSNFWFGDASVLPYNNPTALGTEICENSPVSFVKTDVNLTDLANVMGGVYWQVENQGTFYDTQAINGNLQLIIQNGILACRLDGSSNGYQILGPAATTTVRARPFINYLKRNGTTTRVYISEDFSPTIPVRTLQPAASVSIKQTGICVGQSLVLEALPVNEGTNAIYQWIRNGQVLSTNKNFQAGGIVNDGDLITVRYESTKPCLAQKEVATSQAIIKIYANNTPQVILSSEQGNVICEGDSITFNTNTLEAGDNPIYKWYINNTLIEDYNNPQLSLPSLNNADAVKVEIVPDYPCTTNGNLSANLQIIVVEPDELPKVSLLQPPSICKGTPFTFTAQSIRLDSDTHFQWFKNGQSVGIDSPSYIATDLADGDTVQVMMIPEEDCFATDFVLSNKISANVIDFENPIISIIDKGNLCALDASIVKLETDFQFEGSQPTFQWYKIVNGAPQILTGERQANLVLPDLANRNGEQYQIQMTSSLPCVNQQTVSSQVYTLNVVSIPQTPKIKILSNLIGSEICPNTKPTFIAQTELAGNNPTLEWSVIVDNIVLETSNDTIYIPNVTFPEDKNIEIKLLMLSNSLCATQTPVIDILALRVVNPIESAVFIDTTTNIICERNLVTFFADPINGGISPKYRWFVNQVPQTIFKEQPYFISANLQNGDSITVEMQAGFECAEQNPVVSTPIVVEVKPLPKVSINANFGNFVCENQPVTFKALPQFAGTKPNYQWKINGTNIGLPTQVDSLVRNDLATGQIISVELIADDDADCPGNKKAESFPPIRMQVEENINITLLLTSNQGNTLCENSEAVFTVSPVSVLGFSIYDPFGQFQWKINNLPAPLAQTNGNKFITNQLKTGDVVSCSYISSFSCVRPQTANSNEIQVQVTELAAPTELKAMTGNGLKVNLTWKDNSNRESRFLIERSEDINQFFVQRAYVPANQSNYIDQFSLQPLTTYFYRVRAVVDNYANCFSDFSNESGAATGISDIITNLDELNDNTLTVFPNPSTNGVFNLRYLGNPTEMDIEVRNLVGQSLLKKSTQFKINEATSLDLSKYANGMYWLFVRKGNKQMVIKILRE